jgi:hypothetical protein
MIVHLPISWRGTCVAHGARSPRERLFQSIVPIRVPILSGEEAVEVCRRRASWSSALGQTISTRWCDGRFLRPTWNVGCSRQATASDLVESFRAGELLRAWKIADGRYLEDGPRTINAGAPLGPDAAMKRWDGDDREARIAFATRWIEDRCTLVEGIVHERCAEPVLIARSTAPGTHLDAVVPDARGSVVFDDTDKRVFDDFVGPYASAASADTFRLDRAEAAAEHASVRWQTPPSDVAAVDGLEIVRPHLLAYADEDLAIAGVAAEVYRRLSISMPLLPRPAVEALLDLRDARTPAAFEGRIEAIANALTAFEALDEATIAPALAETFPNAILRLRAGLLRHEMFVAPTPDLPAFAPSC